MTTTELEKGQEILQTISALKRSLAQLNASKLFDCDDYGAYPDRHKANSFLANLHTTLKSNGVAMLCEKIDELEKEFNAL